MSEPAARAEVRELEQLEKRIRGRRKSGKVGRMLPDGWKLAELTELTEAVMVGIASAATHAYAEVGIPMLRNQNIRPGFLDLSDLLFIEPSFEHQHRNKRLRAGDVLVVRTGYPGVSAVVPAALENAQCFTSLIVRPVHQRLNAEFFSQYMNSVMGQRETAAAEAGGAQKNLNAGELEKMKLLVPPIDEQLRITEVAEQWDKAISTTEKLLANSRRQKQGLMELLLGGKRRLHGHATTRHTYRLGELFSERVETDRGDLLLLSVTRDEGVIPRDEVGRKDTSNEDKSKYLRVCPGDIAYNTMRMWQGVSALSRYEGIVSPAYTVVVPNQKIDAQFAAYLFKYAPVVFLFYRYSQGLVSDTWNLKFPHFSEIKVEIPGLEEQVAIANALKDADGEIIALERQLDHLHNEKRTLMADLLTGKRRVHLMEVTTESEAA